MANSIKNKVKQTVICLTIACTAPMANAHVLNGEGCESLNMNKISEILNENKSQYVKNPFNNQRCVPISMESKNALELTKEDFANSKGLFNVYKQFLKTEETMVSEITVSGNRLVKMFKIDEDNPESIRLRERFSDKKLLSANYDQWSFFHEMMHLSERPESDFPIRQKREAVADIGSVLMISVNNGMTMDDTLELMTELYKARRNDAKYDTRKTGQHAAVGHYNKTAFRTAIKNMEAMKDEGFEINVDPKKDINEAVKKIELIAFDMHNMDVSDFKKKYFEKHQDIARKNSKEDDSMSMG